MNKPEYLIIHTEASPISTDAPRFDVVNQYHRQRLFDRSSLGFYVGYHYFIEKAGKILQSRADIDEGMHTVGYNLKSLGICLAGNGDMELPTLAQTETLKKLINEKAKQYNIPKNKILPHRLLLNHHEKTCYGQLLKDDWAASLVEEKVEVINKQKQILSLQQQILNLISRILALLTKKK